MQMVARSALTQTRVLHIISIVFMVSLLAGCSLIPQDAVVIGAGDIADCATPGAKETAKLLDQVDGTVITLGDNAYPSGKIGQYLHCYDPYWGRAKLRTRPAPGNHEYESPEAAPYFAYYGEAAGQLGLGYYSYDAGAWHVISLNSNIAADTKSKQEQWLRADLEAHRTTCTLAYWHHPLFSSGIHGDDPPKMLDVWRTLYAYGVDVVLNGHDHDYERFAPQDPDGKVDPLHGIREFVVGTGGAPQRHFRSERANSEARDDHTWGVLKLTLHAASYDWEFIPIAGGQFHDTGSAACVQ